MKKVLFILALASFAGCSSDDDNQNVDNCNCQKITAVYHEDSEVFEPISTAFYSNNCEDQTNNYHEDGEGNYFRIECTQN